MNKFAVGDKIEFVYIVNNKYKPGVGVIHNITSMGSEVVYKIQSDTGNFLYLREDAVI